MIQNQTLPDEIFSGYWQTGHCQGIAVDTKREYIYMSFTTMLVKLDMQGNLIGSVTGLLGHLGCIDFCDEDGRLYGSLEYKNDAIGKGILQHLGSDAQLEDAFYIAVFDVDKIDCADMDATESGVMKAVYLKEVVDDFNAEVTCGGKCVSHRHGCSGIDGVTFAPIPGSADGKKYLMVAYGIYGDVTRADNDDQVILCYDTADWSALMQPLRQDDMHHLGPAAPAHKFFLYTGNTEWGVQNLEYDEFSGNIYLAVYQGKKEQFPNYPMFVIDGKAAPMRKVLSGVEPAMEGETLTLLKTGLVDEKTGLSGLSYPHGSTGLCSLGDGSFYVSHPGHDREKGWCTTVTREKI